MLNFLQIPSNAHTNNKEKGNDYQKNRATKESIFSQSASYRNHKQTILLASGVQWVENRE